MADKICMKRKWSLWFSAFLLAKGIFAQPDTIPPVLPDPAIRLEDIFQDRDEAAETFDFNTLFENQARYLKRPLQLNKAGELELRESGLFTEQQVMRFLQYRDVSGPLLAVYELQAIPGFELADIRQILPFVTVGSELADLQLSPKQWFTDGRTDLYLRWYRQLEPQKGFLPPSSPESSFFEGDPNHLYFRVRHVYQNRFSIGITAEKDPGEAFFRGSNPQGFDFYSAHVFMRDYNKTLKAVALGDYSVSFGQGLILNTGFGYGKSPSSMDIKRGGRALSAFSSVNEASFFRGGAATLGLGKNWETTFFLSSRRRDANVSEAADPEEGELPLSITSILLAGLHRTASEIEDEKAFRQTTAGANLLRRFPKGQIAANLVYDRLDKTLSRNPQPYNLFYFRGDRLLNLSIDYAWRVQNLHFFGETALSDNGAMATINGLLAGLDRKIDLSVLVRHFSPRFQTFYGAPFAETTGANNETGFFLGAEIRPIRLLRINAYFDLWKHPWLRYQTDAPSYGHDWLLRFTFFKKRSWEAYWQIRGETKERNNPVKTDNTNTLATRDLFFSRWHLSFQLHKSLELRSRLEWGRFLNEGAPGPQTGMVFYQDVLYKPLGIPFSFSTRFALFDTDGYDVRFYSFENDLLYSFSIPAYYDRGSRFYFNIRYKGIPNLTLEARYATSFFPGNLEIGSGVSSTPGDTRSELGAQVNWSF